MVIRIRNRHFGLCPRCGSLRPYFNKTSGQESHHKNDGEKRGQEKSKPRLYHKLIDLAPPLRPSFIYWRSPQHAGVASDWGLKLGTSYIIGLVLASYCEKTSPASGTLLAQFNLRRSVLCVKERAYAKPKDTSWHPALRSPRCSLVVLSQILVTALEGSRAQPLYAMILSFWSNKPSFSQLYYDY